MLAEASQRRGTPKVFDPSDRLRSDPFAHYHAVMRIREERAAQAETGVQTTAQQQQRIRNAAAKRAALARPDPCYKPIFPGSFPS
jgi:hypothetical protein